MIRTYYLLMKPGIIMGNLITTVSGFALASRGSFDPFLFTSTLFGLGALIGSACVLNNCIDREIDAKMSRTKRRPLVVGLITQKQALLFATLTALLGIAILYLYTNPLALFIALLGYLIYVVPYSFGKCRTTYSTAIGSISGAIPPIVGYCAVSSTFDMGAALLFMVLVLWQMPHSFAIAMFRLNDYKAASIQTMPVTHGPHATKVRMLLYIIGFTLASLSLAFYTGYFYLIAALFSAISWLYLSIRGFKAQNNEMWARQMFRLSLLIITLLCIAISFDTQ
jgi:protoheme IX farnesyltransferase